MTIDKALLDVRKAYRLLGDYQQRVLELLGFIRELLGAVHYQQSLRCRPPRSLDRLEHSDDGGARLLPFNDVSVLWLRDGGQAESARIHCAGDVLIDVWVRSDSGNGADNEPQQTVEDSCSELRIFFFLCVTPAADGCDWFSHVWSQTAYPPLGEVMACEGNPGYLAYGEALDLATLTDEVAVRAAVTALRQRASARLGLAV